jgi:cellulose synthase/poly-beta-1,6-N-acetylglucosamine synthase-like glycosyltransferase
LIDALRLDYPPEKLEIAVVSDGSTDRTAAIVRGFADRGVRLFDERERRGKAGAIANAVPRLRGEVVLLSDANTRLEPGAAARLARWFGDPEVGVATARLVLTDPASGRNADGLYWNYECRIRAAEARLGALLGANGAAYAIRRDLFPDIPAGTIVDDLVIPLLARLRSGCSIVLDGSAVAREEAAPGPASEFRRRARIGAGGWQALAILGPLLDPRRGWIAFALLSHKVLRWSGPFLLVAIAVSGAWIAWEGGWLGPAVTPALVLGLMAALALAVPGRWARPARLPGLFLLLNAALLAGFIRWATGRASGTWTPTPRRAEIPNDPPPGVPIPGADVSW